MIKTQVNSYAPTEGLATETCVFRLQHIEYNKYTVPHTVHDTGIEDAKWWNEYINKYIFENTVS